MKNSLKGSRIQGLPCQTAACPATPKGVARGLGQGFKDSSGKTLDPSTPRPLDPFIKPKWQISCVIYDCDGVLFDSLEANGRLYNLIATSMGRPPLTENELKYCHTHTVYESIHHMFRDDEASEKRAIEFLKEQVDFKEFIVYLKMEPNILETLTQLEKRGIARAISTNRTTSMKHIMERFGLWPFFDMVVTALDVKNPKPNPESVEKILAALSIDREQTLYVGDSEVDRDTALSSGVRFIAYKNQELQADGFIDDHLALLKLLSNGQYPQG